MKINFKYFLLCCVVVSLAFNTANNFDESLLLRKWRPVKFEENGKVQEEPENTEKSLEFKKDYTFILDGKEDNIGKWEFDKEKNTLKMTKDFEILFTIDKLSKEELILSGETEGIKLKMYLVPAQ